MGPVSRCRARTRGRRPASEPFGTRPWAAAALARWVRSASYLQKWIVLGVVIGAIAGLRRDRLLRGACGSAPTSSWGSSPATRVPTPAARAARRRLRLSRPAVGSPLVAGVGALLGAILVYRFAPEAEGHGTDAAISAVHHNPAGVRFRAVIVKIVASALTIGSGGSGGREGPDRADQRRLRVAPGPGARPRARGRPHRRSHRNRLGNRCHLRCAARRRRAGAEILYRDDFDPAALLPCFIASVGQLRHLRLGRRIRPAVRLRRELPLHATRPAHLVRAHRHLRRARSACSTPRGSTASPQLSPRCPVCPKWVNPAIGGLMVGAIGIAIPEVLGTGYGWIQTGARARAVWASRCGSC